MAWSSRTEWTLSSFGEPWRIWLVPPFEPQASGPSRAALVGDDNPLGTLLYSGFDDTGAVSDEIAVMLLGIYDALTGRGVLEALDDPSRPTDDPRGLLRGFERELAEAIHGAVAAGRLRMERDTPAPWPFPDVADEPAVPPAQPMVDEATTFVGVHLQDQRGEPVPHATYQVTLPDGSERTGALNGSGDARVDGISPPGVCRLVFTDFDARDFSSPSARLGGRAPDPQRPVEAKGGLMYRARAGDTLVAIASQFGFANYETIWNAPENDELRRRRENPQALLEGDEIAIPERRVRTHSLHTGAQHTVTVFIPRVVVRVRLFAADGAPVTNELAVAGASGAPESVEPNADGQYDVALSAQARALTLAHGADVRTFAVGALDPIDTPSGLRQRLNNLGYDAGDEDDPTDEALRWAIEECERDHGMKPKGEAGDAFLDRLRDLHGS